MASLHKPNPDNSLFAECSRWLLHLQPQPKAEQRAGSEGKRTCAGARRQAAPRDPSSRTELSKKPRMSLTDIFGFPFQPSHCSMPCTILKRASSGLISESIKEKPRQAMQTCFCLTQVPQSQRASPDSSASRPSSEITQDTAWLERNTPPSPSVLGMSPRQPAS